MRFIIKNWLKLIFLISVIAISSAFIAEYFFKLFPCEMCLKQRYAYYSIILICIIFYFFQRINKMWIYVLTELSILYGLFYSIWHVGIEQNIISGPASCSGSITKTNSIENLKEQIINQPIINCSDISWSILGFSAATINVVLLLFILIFNSISIINNFYESKKNN